MGNLLITLRVLLCQLKKIRRTKKTRLEVKIKELDYFSRLFLFMLASYRPNREETFGTPASVFDGDVERAALALAEDVLDLVRSIMQR
jgi:hypothetical protein